MGFKTEDIYALKAFAEEHPSVNSYLTVQGHEDRQYLTIKTSYWNRLLVSLGIVSSEIDKVAEYIKDLDLNDVLEKGLRKKEDVLLYASLSKLKDKLEIYTENIFNDRVAGHSVVHLNQQQSIADQAIIKLWMLLCPLQFNYDCYQIRVEALEKEIECLKKLKRDSIHSLNQLLDSKIEQKSEERRIIINKAAFFIRQRYLREILQVRESYSQPIQRHIKKSL